VGIQVDLSVKEGCADTACLARRAASKELEREEPGLVIGQITCRSPLRTHHETGPIGLIETKSIRWLNHGSL
jgi:hypothetical protein